MLKRHLTLMAGVAIISTGGLLQTAMAGEVDWKTVHEVRNYMNYEEREACQYYREQPAALVGRDRCAPSEPTGQVINERDVKLMPVIAKYEIYFDFNQSIVRQDQFVTLHRLANELHRYDPAQITVTGHTDTAGSSAYNQKLSQERALAVSKALTGRNIPHFLMQQVAMGESDLAVPTPDNTKSEYNRRVVIEFRKQ